MTRTDAVRPTDKILSPHGEAYCTVCRFVVGVTEKGRLDFHERTSITEYGHREPQKRCKGSGRRAGKGRIPVTSRLSAFGTRAPRGTCPKCEKQMKLNGQGCIPSHRSPNLPSPAICEGSWEQPLR